MVNAWIFFRISGGLFNPAVRPLPPNPNLTLTTMPKTGNPRPPPHPRPRPHPRPPPPPNPTLRLLLLRLPSLHHLPLPLQRTNHSRGRHNPRPRRLDRSHLHGRTNLHHNNAGQRKAPRNLHRAGRNRSLPIHRRTSSRAIHRWFSQPCQIFRPCGRGEKVSKQSLDLLGRSCDWSVVGCGVLLFDEGAGV